MFALRIRLLSLPCLPKALGRYALWALLFFSLFPPAVAQDQGANEESATALESLLGIGQELWEQHAPPELQEQYRLPTFEEAESFLANMERALQEGDFPQLAPYAEHAPLALSILRQFEGGDSLADWLQPRIDYLVAAQRITERPTPPPSPKAQSPSSASLPLEFTQPYWNQTMASRPLPKLAERYMPIFKRSFASKRVPPELAWLSEVESSLNLHAKSPVGAYGPFQFMPATAERFGLKIGSPDERSHPEKSSAAAASYLKILYNQFQSWPLALAAYNAGEGRVGRTMKSHGAKTFDELSPHLPAETRMYVPKVLATVAARESIDPATFR